EEQRRVAGDVGAPGDARPDLAARAHVARLEAAADDALLHPDLAGGELAVLGEAGDLRRGAGAARRAGVGAPGGEDEVAAVGAGRGPPKELDVVDLGAARAGDAGGYQRLADPPGDVGQRLDVGEVDGAVPGREKEPVSAPGDVPNDGADAAHAGHV